MNVIFLVVFKVKSSGFGDSGDLLNPLSLFQFSAVTRVKDPPTKESKWCKHCSAESPWSAELWPTDTRWISLNRNAETSAAGPGLLLLPLPVLRSGVHTEFSDPPALSLHEVWARALRRSNLDVGGRWPSDVCVFYFSPQHAAGQDVLLHWRHHGLDSGGICSQN